MMKILTRIAVIFLLAAGVYFLRETNEEKRLHEVASENEATEQVQELVVEEKKQEPRRAPIVVTPPKSETTSTKKTTAVTQPSKTGKAVTATFYPTVPIKVYLYEWGIDFSDKTIPTGNVIFEVENSGKFSHNFTIMGVRNFGNVGPGETAVFFSPPLRRGTYQIGSTKRVDRDRGMFDSFYVQ